MEQALQSRRRYPHRSGIQSARSDKNLKFRALQKRASGRCGRCGRRGRWVWRRKGPPPGRIGGCPPGADKHSNAQTLKHSFRLISPYGWTATADEQPHASSQGLQGLPMIHPRCGFSPPKPTAMCPHHQDNGSSGSLRSPCHPPQDSETSCHGGRRWWS